ncbi:hypothetical protein [Leifsonia xyli]|uniref:hypothetical protein n=1 Tax=Leifsonia xyli TaxID=1575 RepID=UPI003D670970
MSRRIRRLAWALALLLSGVGAVAAPANEARAGWGRTSLATATVTSGTLSPVPQVSCGARSGFLADNIPISWTASPAGGNALTPQSYTLRWSGTAGSGSSTVTATNGSVSAATLTLLGTSTVTVTATYAGWSSPVSLETRTITTAVAVGDIFLRWTCS